MTRVVALPHLQTAAVDPGEWLVTVRSETMPVPDLLPGWDFSTPLRFECQMAVDLDQARADCQIGGAAEVLAVAGYWASSTNRRAVATIRAVDRGGQVPLAFDVQPGGVGGRLTLFRQLVLGEAADPLSAFAAVEPGSILWSEERASRAAMVLEGDAARFPTDIVDFELAPVADAASAWWLYLDYSDLEASPLASMRLHLNSKHPSLEALIGGADDPVAKILGSVLAWDVGRAMVHEALDSRDFVDAWGTFSEGSLGETLESLLRRVWPSHDARALCSMRSQDRGLFEARLQGRLAILGGGR